MGNLEVELQRNNRKTEVDTNQLLFVPSDLLLECAKTRWNLALFTEFTKLGTCSVERSENLS